MSSAESARALLGVPPSTATTKDSILIIIDAQNEYAQGALAVTNLATSRPAIHSLLQRYRAAQGHVAHIVHTVPEGAPVFTPGTSLAEEFEELKMKPGNESDHEVLVKKKFPGSFAETELDEVVKKAGVKKVVLTGYMAHVCVSTTAREAHQRGYEVLVVEDAIGDRDIPEATGDQLTKVSHYQLSNLPMELMGLTFSVGVIQTVLAELGDFFATIVKSSDIQ
jgi:nicotinamidase-related amidase